jgi:hypothetical protein
MSDEISDLRVSARRMMLIARLGPGTMGACI